jgi:2,4-dienoyl-CoA reductase-like NADH-dependent reductase (Old Yellow Enzyme family)
MTSTISYKDLFEPLEVKGKTIPNRIVMPPMVTVRNILKPDGRRWYVEHARGGVGLVIVEATPLGLLVEKNLPALRRLVDAVHKEGALIAIQLFSNGDPEPGVLFFEKAYEPHELTRQQLIGLIGHFARAAKVCREAGFDGVEPHGAHGYFLTRCFSPVHNRREDEFGGAVENRLRTAEEVCRKIRKAIGRQMLLLYRHTPVEEAEGGYTLAETLQLVRALVDAGVDVLDVSPSHGDREGEYSEALRLASGLPVIARGGLDEPGKALSMLQNRRADLLAVGRGLIADAEWPRKVREGRTEDILKCIRCNEKCFGNLRRREPVACTQWGEDE